MDSNIKSLLAMGRMAKKAARQLAYCDSKKKEFALFQMARSLLKMKGDILAANDVDMLRAQEKGRSKAMLDRLFLDENRIEAMIQSLEKIASLKDPIGEVIASWKRPNGLKFNRVRTPLGVIGMIYESRPNVTADAAALCLKSGNAVILRSGSDAFTTSRAIYHALIKGLEESVLSKETIQFIPTCDREAVGLMLSGLNQSIDVIIPRGGKSLVERVQKEARVPVFAHLDGVCHIYVDQSADIVKAQDVILNSKMRRTGICGAAETLLLDRGCSQAEIVKILDSLFASGCEIRASSEICAFFDKAKLACDTDFGREFLDAIIAVKLVDGVEGAIAHIEDHSSYHTEVIIAEDKAKVDRFFCSLDSAILLQNASTQFADGGEFGFGAEIGIATGKMHARGPIGLEQLTSFQYHIYGEGQIRD